MEIPTEKEAHHYTIQRLHIFTAGIPTTIKGAVILLKARKINAISVTSPVK